VLEITAVAVAMHYAKFFLLCLFTQDKADDIQIGVKSTALKFGDNTKQWLMGFASGVSGGLAVAGAMCHQPWLYFAGVGIVSAHLVHQVLKLMINTWFKTTI